MLPEIPPLSMEMTSPHSSMRIFGAALTAVLILSACGGATGSTVYRATGDGSRDAPIRTFSSRSRAASSARSKSSTSVAPLSSATLAAVQKLLRDLDTIKKKSGVTETQKQKLYTDVTSALNGAKPPSSSLVSKLKSDYATAWADKTLSSSEKTLLLNDVMSVLLSMGISPAKVNAVIVDLQDIIKSSNLTDADLALIIADLQAIANTLR